MWERYRGSTRHLRRLGLHRTRIENGVASGTPDTNEALLGREWWLEFKVCERPKAPRGPVQIKWRKGQQEWLYRRCRVGCRAYLFLQVGKARAARRYLIQGRHTPFLEGLCESNILVLSIVAPTASSDEILLAAAGLTPEDIERASPPAD